jgi:hypothetical protein
MKTMKTMMIGIMVIAFSFFATGALAETLVLQNGLDSYTGTDDTMLNWYNAEQGNDNFGAYPYNLVGNGYTTDPVNTLLRFSGLDVLQGEYTVITSATLTLTQKTTNSPAANISGKVFQISDANAGWVEGTKSDADASTGESCGYYKAYDATTPANSTPWTGGYGMEGTGGTTGGAMGSFTIFEDQSAGTTYEIPLSTAVIEHWIEDTNAGMLIKDSPRAGGSPDYEYCGFETSESATASYRPKLTINYRTTATNYKTFKFGWWDSFSQEGSATAIAAEGANFAICYGQADNDGIEDWLDDAEDEGLMVSAGVYPVDVLGKDVTAMQAFATRFKDHAAVDRWFIFDEPSAQYHDECQVAYNAITAIAQVQYVDIVFCYTDSTVSDFGDCYNTILFDNYPCRTDESEFTLARINDFKSKMDWVGDEAIDINKPWMAVLQAFGGRYDTLEFRLPTSNEARFMSYYAIHNGAAGIVFYPRYRTLNVVARESQAYPDSGADWIDDVFEPMADEMQTLCEAIGHGTVGGFVSDDTIDVLGDLYQDPDTDTYYLVAMNVMAGSETVVFTVSVPGATYAKLLFEGAEDIEIVNGTFTDTFDGYGIHVYEFHAPEPATMTLLVVGGVALILRKRK